MSDRSRKRVYGAARPMTGFLATLTAEQRERALAYRGPENFGDESMAKASTPPPPTTSEPLAHLLEDER